MLPSSGAIILLPRTDNYLPVLSPEGKHVAGKDLASFALLPSVL